MTAITSLDAHEQPSEYLRKQWKAYSRASPAELDASGDIDEVDSDKNGKNESEKNENEENGRIKKNFVQAGVISADRIREAFTTFLGDDNEEEGEYQDVPMYSHPLLPGLLVVPQLVPPTVQLRLLDRMVHRDLVCPRHQTNLHLHYTLPYPPDGASFFSSPRTSEDLVFVPKDPSVHRPLSTRQVLDRRLHWVTLGGQYDWTRRVYDDDQPAFPPDLAHLLGTLFPETRPEAAIVNFYTPGDTMMMHRDVSEETDRGLVSLSLGCDALFMAAPTGEFKEEEGGEEVDGKKEDKKEEVDGKKKNDNDDNSKKNDNEEKDNNYILLRLRSGDAIYMTGHARFAWHGVPKVLKDTCPAYLAEWPAGEHNSDDDDPYESWRGWMRNKRVNLNVRQMRD